MKILSSYILKEFLKITLICEVVFVAIYLVVDFFQKMDNFMQVGASWTVMFSYFLYKTPFITAQLLPSAVLIGAIILLSIMRRNREITALKACGVNLYSLFRYLALAALVFSAVLFLFSEVMVRNTTAKYNDIWMYEVEKRDPKERYYYGLDQIWYRAPGRIYWIQAFDEETGVM
ncbi:MAG: LptF/LptG family permease, partial [Desulfobacteraceae bacterium]